MKRRTKRGGSWLVILLLAASVALWVHEQRPWIPGTERQEPAGGGTPPVSASGYEVYRNCRLVPHSGNDGDSFLCLLPDGRKEIFRLYFVDAPESAFKRYRNGQTNHDRIRDQARDLGGITPELAVETGKRAARFTLELLESSPFTLYTLWDSPFNDGRYHAFVEVRVDGSPRWLHELLVENGLARLKTKPADLPDGTPAKRQSEKLRQLQQEAIREKAGVWSR